MGRFIKFLLIILLFASVGLVINPQQTFAQNQQRVETAVGAVDSGGGTSGKVKFYCQYGKVNDAGAMAPGGDHFWDRPGCYIYGSGCGPTSIAMILSSFGGKEYTPIEVSNAIPSTHYNAGIGCQEGGTFISSDRSRDDMHNIDNWVESKGFHMTGNMVSNEKINLSQVREYLNRGYLVAAGADVRYVDRGGYTNDFAGHFFVISGIDSNNDLHVVDPTFCRLSYINGTRKLTDVNNLSLRGRTNVSRWILAYAIKPKN